MKNSYFLRSILLFTFISFLNCISAVNGNKFKVTNDYYGDGDGNDEEYNEVDDYNYEYQDLDNELLEKPPGEKKSKYGSILKGRTLGGDKFKVTNDYYGDGDGNDEEYNEVDDYNYEYQDLDNDKFKVTNDYYGDGDGNDEEYNEVDDYNYEYQDLDNACGNVPLALFQPNTRVVGGTNAKFGAWPWQVSIRMHGQSHHCGGVIIKRNWVVTAAHCVMNLWNWNIVIRAGEYDLLSTEEPLPFVEKRVVKIILHTGYAAEPQIYDIAMLKLESPLAYDFHIRPICLLKCDDLFVGETATVTGWGRLWDKGPFPSILQEVSVPILSNTECENMFARSGLDNPYVPDEWLCAGLENGGKDACECDSGGPLQMKSNDGRYFLAGIVHGGQGCAEPNKPGVYMRISKFVPWIQEIIRNF